MYGGALLSYYHIGIESNMLIDLLKVNSNLIVVCDSDITEEKSELKPAVQRILNEAKVFKAFTWITQPKEIENYVPGEVWTKVFNAKDTLPDPKEKERFFTATKNQSYYKKINPKAKTINKVYLAKSCIKHMTLDNMKGRFDWEAQMNIIVDKIQKWNT
jgi:hypothetical protein